MHRIQTIHLHCNRWMFLQMQSLLIGSEAVLRRMMDTFQRTHLNLELPQELHRLFASHCLTMNRRMKIPVPISTISRRTNGLHSQKQAATRLNYEKQRATRRTPIFGESPAKKEFCKELYDSWAAMMYHVNNNHAKGTKNTYECNLCKGSSQRKQFIRRHVAAVLKPSKCPNRSCLRRFAINKNLKSHSHIQTVHDEHKKNGFECPKCFKSLYHRSALEIHLAIIMHQYLQK